MQDKTVLIIGGGTGGIAMAAALRRKRPSLNLVLLEPSTRHYYQPIFTLVGGGDFDYRDSWRPMAAMIPPGVRWIPEAAVAVDPVQRTVQTGSGRTESWDYLVLAPGIVLNWKGIEGMSESLLGRHGICSNYSADKVTMTWEILQKLRRGRAVFTYPGTPIKCGGAPQKIMWLAQHYLEKQGVADQVEIVFATPGPRIFGVEKYRHTLERLVEERHIHTMFGYELHRIDPENQVATFRCAADGSEKELSWDMLHVTPPMAPPAFIAASGLGNADGWTDVDPRTARHQRYPAVFGIGDASSLPTGKTGAAIRKQVPVVIEGILADLEGRQPRLTYDGYTSCPVVTGYGRLVLAEFDYDGKPVETFPFDQAKERRSMYWLKKYGLPLLYWHGMMKGRA